MIPEDSEGSLSGRRFTWRWIGVAVLVLMAGTTPFVGAALWELVFSREDQHAEITAVHDQIGSGMDYREVFALAERAGLSFGCPDGASPRVPPCRRVVIQAKGDWACTIDLDASGRVTGVGAVEYVD